MLQRLTALQLARNYTGAAGWLARRAGRLWTGRRRTKLAPHLLKHEARELLERQRLEGRILRLLPHVILQCRN